MYKITELLLAIEPLISRYIREAACLNVPGVNFINILQATFLYKELISSSVFEFKLVFFGER